MSLEDFNISVPTNSRYWLAQRKLAVLEAWRNGAEVGALAARYAMTTRSVNKLLARSEAHRTDLLRELTHPLYQQDREVVRLVLAAVEAEALLLRDTLGEMPSLRVLLDHVGWRLAMHAVAARVPHLEGLTPTVRPENPAVAAGPRPRRRAGRDRDRSARALARLRLAWHGFLLGWKGEPNSEVAP